ncbi:MAG TPA: CPBP family intramembrane glutamic endopeptidase [Candidatus Acidoferrales bacterium]
MSSIGDSNVPQSNPGQTPEKRPLLGVVFIGPNGLRAGWHLSIYIVIVLALGYALNIALHHIHALQKYFAGSPSGVLAPVGLIVSESLVAFIVLAAAWIMSLIEKRPFGEYGMPLSQAFGKRFWEGMLWGIATISAVIGLIASVGAYSFGPLALSGAAIFRNAVLWLIGFFLVGVFEEFAFRGYMQYTLGSGIGFWPAASILSALFAGAHLTNPGEGPIGALSVVVIAIFFCLTLRRTGNLWFAIGLHCSFDWGETFLYSVPNSGTITAGALSHSTLHGARWITGGAVGPEGSVFCFLCVALLFLLFHLKYPPKRA